MRKKREYSIKFKVEKLQGKEEIVRGKKSTFSEIRRKLTGREEALRLRSNQCG